MKRFYISKRTDLNSVIDPKQVNACQHNLFHENAAKINKSCKAFYVMKSAIEIRISAVQTLSKRCLSRSSAVSNFMNIHTVQP